MNLRVVISFYLLDALAQVDFVAIDTLIFFFVLLLDIQFSLIVWWDTCSFLCASIFSILFCDLSVLHPNNQCKTKQIFLLWVHNPHCNRLLLLFALLSLLFFSFKIYLHYPQNVKVLFFFAVRRTTLFFRECAQGWLDGNGTSLNNNHL